MTGSVSKPKKKQKDKKTPPKPPEDLAIVPEPAPEESLRYWEAVGRRKTSVARVRLFTKGDKGISVNDRPLQEYFSQKEFQELAVSPLSRMKNIEKFRV